MKQTIIISAFPGVGKTYFKEHSELQVLDSDSSKFNKEEFPDNYISHIKENIGKVDVILVSSHKEVRIALEDNKIDFIVVYPKWEMKETYLRRYKNRGNSQKFIDFISNNWDEFIKDIERYNWYNNHVIVYDRYLSDVFHGIKMHYEFKGNLTNMEWKELCGLEYHTTQYPASAKHEDWDRYKYLQNKK